MVPIAPIMTGIALVLTFHIRRIAIVKSLYFRISRRLSWPQFCLLKLQHILTYTVIFHSHEIFLVSNFRHVLTVVCFFCVIPRRLNFICRHFGTFCVFHLHGQIGMKKEFFLHTYPPMKMEQTKCSETSAYKIQTPRNYPEEGIHHDICCPVYC